MNKVTTSSSAKQLSGIWRSDYIYRSSDRNEDRKSVEYVRFYPSEHGFVIETVPKANESYELGRFTLEGEVATGTWQSSTSPKGDYRGAVYHGAAQLIVKDDGKRLVGKWVGFGKNMVVKTGPWEFTYLGDDASVLDDLGVAHGQ